MSKYSYTESKLQSICEHINNQEVNSSKAERESIKLKQIEYLADKIGEEYKAVITGIKKWGIYCEIVENKCEGMISTDELDYLDFNIDVDNYKINTPNNKLIRLGDVITVKVRGVSMIRKEIEYGFVQI